MLDTLAERFDLVGDRRPLRLVFGQSSKVCLMPDPVAELGALLLQGGDALFRLLDFPVYVGDGMETIFLEEAVVCMELDDILELVPQLSRQDHLPGLIFSNTWNPMDSDCTRANSGDTILI